MRARLAGGELVFQREVKYVQGGQMALDRAAEAQREADVAAMLATFTGAGILELEDVLLLIALTTRLLRSQVPVSRPHDDVVMELAARLGDLLADVPDEAQIPALLRLVALGVERTAQIREERLTRG